MTRLLVSVRNAAEAQEVVAAGVHLVDVKEPSRGALGSADATTLQEVLSIVAGRCPVSAALGELTARPSQYVSGLPLGIRFAKLGLSRCATRDDWSTAWGTALRNLPCGTDPVAVAYADHRAAQAPPPIEVLTVGRRLGCRALLVDTFDKSGGTLFDHLTPKALEQLLARARDSGLLTALAGSLNVESLDRAARLNPDYVAVRGAVCRGGRQGPIDGARVRRFVALLGTHAPIPASGV